MANLELGDNQKATLTLSGGADGAGNPANPPYEVVAGSVTWSIADTSTVTLDVAADTLSAVATAVGGLTAATNVVSATDGTLTGTLGIDVLATAAASLEITASAPEAK